MISINIKDPLFTYHARLINILILILINMINILNIPSFLI